MLKKILVAIAVIALAGCASSGGRIVPMKVQSDPLGAYVLFQIQGGEESASYDWIFLGNTPVDIRKEISDADLEHANSFVLRVLKEGYLEQKKSFTARDFYRETNEKGTVFWNPKLVPSGS